MNPVILVVTDATGSNLISINGFHINANVFHIDGMLVLNFLFCL